MNKHRMFVIGLILFALFLIGAAIWMIMTPPVGDEKHGYAMIAIGILMLFVGYGIERREKTPE